jgi:hypothetical protein
LIDNGVWGRLNLNLIFNLELRGNRIYYEGEKPIQIDNVGTVTKEGNTVQEPPQTK